MGQASLDDIVSNQGPAAVSAAPVGGTAHVDDIVSNQGPAPAAPGTTGVSGFLNKVGEGGAEAAGDIWGAVKNLALTPGSPLQIADQVKQVLPLIDSYERARSGGASITDSLKAVNDTAVQHVKNIASVKPVVDAFHANPTRETARALTDAAALAASMFVGGGEAAAPEEAAAAPVVEPAAAAKPSGFLGRVNPFRKGGLVQQATQGEGIAQAPAQEAARTAVKTGGAEVGLSTAQPASIRTIVEEPINAVNGLKKNIYGQVDKAAGTDIKTLYDKLDNINDKIDLEASGSPEEARLEAQRASQMQTIEDAKTTARTKGVDVDKLLSQGDALHTREMALRDLQKSVFKNVNVVEGNTAAGTPETMNVDSTIKALQKLQDNTKFGAPRLEQALGKQGAKDLLNRVYAAQRAGQSAVQVQNMISRTIRGLEIVGVGGGILGGAYALSR